MKRSSKGSPQRDLHELCADVRPEDGLSPQELARRRKRRGRKPNHHTFQLCKQVRHAIDAAILCDCGDPIFDELTACWVTPIQGKAGQLLVTFGMQTEDPETLEQAFTSLTQAAPVLRMAVAEAICRKKVPQLRFQVLPVE